MQCPFCQEFEATIESDLAFAIYDKYPVNQGHALIISKRHFAEYFDASADEKQALWQLVDQLKTILDENHQPIGYNVGINCGPAAGQTVMHMHIHFIPRYADDVAVPFGGVRGVIPEKRRY